MWCARCRRPKTRRYCRDEVIVLSNEKKPAPELMRRILALVEIDGKEREMTFLTNNLGWSPRSVADLYRCRWQIEVFFKQIKQTLQLGDFLKATTPTRCAGRSGRHC